jgi:Uncharacterized conserved protein
MYSTAPVKKIVGKFDVKSILKNNPTALWETCKAKAGMSEADFFRYFKGVEKGYAIEICNVKTFKPINPSTVIQNFSAPQSFRYVANIKI